MTLYACDQENIELFSYMKVGNEVPEIRVPADMNSAAGFCVSTQKTVNIADAYDSRELKAFDERLKMDLSWDKKTGFRTRQVLCTPIIYDGKYILGALQFLNAKGKIRFDQQDEILAEKVCISLAQTMQKYVSAPADKDIPEDIMEILLKYEIDISQGAAKAVNDLILENRDLKDRLKKCQAIFEGLK
ncbi:MAG: GAF domain-containing protein [Desulfobacterales bacterium]